MQEYFHKFLKLVKSLLFLRKEIKNSWRTTGLRPVSVLPIFGKIFEIILYNRLYNFFTKENVLSFFIENFKIIIKKLYNNEYKKEYMP